MKPSVFSPRTAPLLHSLYSLHWSKCEPPLPPLLLLHPSLHPLFFAHSYDSWAVLSHTRLLKIFGDADDNEHVDDGGDYVF